MRIDDTTKSARMGRIKYLILMAFFGEQMMEKSIGPRDYCW